MRNSLCITMVLIFIILASGCFYSVPKEFELGSIAGIAQGPDLKGIPEVQVTLVGTENVAYTDDTGTFFFGELEPGSYTLSFYKSGFPTQQKNVSVVKGQSRTIIVEMIPGGVAIDPNNPDTVNPPDDNTNNPYVHMLYVANAGPTPQASPNPYNIPDPNNPYSGEYGTGTSGLGIQDYISMLYGADPVSEAYKKYDPNVKVEDILQSIHYADKKRNNLMVINSAYKCPVSIYEWPNNVRPLWIEMSDNGMLYVSDDAYNISVFNTSGDSFYKSTIMNVGEYILCDLALGNSDSRLFCALGSPGDPVVKVIDTTSNSYIQEIPLPRLKDGSIGQPWAITAHNQGQRAYVTLGTDLAGEVVFINTLSNSVEKTVEVGQNPFGIAVTPDGKKLYVANSNAASVSVVDTATGQVINKMQVGINPLRVAVTPDGSKVFVTNKVSNTVSVINTATDSLICNLPVGKAPVGIAVSRDGKMAYVSNSGSDNIAMIDISRNAVIDYTIPFEKGSPFDIAVK